MHQTPNFDEEGFATPQVASLELSGDLAPTAETRPKSAEESSTIRIDAKHGQASPSLVPEIASSKAAENS